MSATSLLINDIKNKLLSSMGIIFIVFGTLGNVLNIVLFIRRALWLRSSSIIYLLAASVANIVTIYPYVISRTLIGFSITPAYFSSAICKLQLYLYYIPICLSSWFMVGCCADRFFSSSRSAVVRRYNTTYVTRRITIVMTIIIVFAYFQVFYCFEANQFSKPAPCFPQNGVCSLVDVVYLFFFQSVGPPVFMLIFGIGTWIHIRQGATDIELVSTTTAIPRVTKTMRKLNQTVLSLLFAQVTIHILCSIPHVAMKIYSSIPLSIVKNDVRLSAENLFLNMSGMASLVDKIFSFYIYTLTSKYFRRELIKLMRGRCRPRRIAPGN